MEIFKSAVKTTNAIAESRTWKNWLSLSKLRSRRRHNINSNTSFNKKTNLNSDTSIRDSIAEKFSTGSYVEAIDLLGQIIRRHPNSAIDYNNRGLIYMRQGRYTEALADLNRAIALDPSLDNAYNNRASCRVQMGETSAALDDYEVALDLNPANVRAWINQGITFRELGLYDLAIENFDIAIALGKKHQGRIYAERGKSYHIRGDWNCAVADYYRALEAFDDKKDVRECLQIQECLDRLLQPLAC
jgi:tetratricopeptide (TPR) repeat protein